MTPLLAGLLHPVTVPLHLAALLALALLIGQQGWGRGVLIVYMAAVLAGLGAIAAAYVPAQAGTSLLALAALTGSMVALDRSLPRVAGWLLGALIGLALGLDSPPETISLRDANLALAGTALGAATALVALALGTSRLRHGWQRIGTRIVGSWIAASAILVLALRMIR